MSSTEVQPIADNFAERCNYRTLTIKYFIVIAAELLPLSFFRQWVVRLVQPIASKCDERCKSTTLTIKWCAEQTWCFAAAEQRIV